MDASHAELPPLTAFPASHVVTFKYYLGVISFLEEHYAEVRSCHPFCIEKPMLTFLEQAEEHLTYAWNRCHRDAKKNRE
jgi:hypothetical protein